MKNFLAFNLVLPLTFFGFALYFMPIGQMFQFDPNDEGIELIKASLHLEGFAMYTQMWNDQPPFSTVILSVWFRLFGQSILTARLLTLSFSTLLIWAFCQTLRRYFGDIAALIGTCLLIISCNFLRLSVSVLFGLPALALAMLSIYCLTLYKQRRSIPLLTLSGSLLALSLQTKLFTAFLVPLIIFDLVQFISAQKCQKLEKQSLVWHVFLWLTAFSLIFLEVGVLCDSLNYRQLLQMHLGSSVKDAFDVSDSVTLALSFLLQDFDYLLLALPATIVILQKRQWTNVFPLAWLITALILLLNHRPVWYHHYLLLSLPLTWLATYGITLTIDFLHSEGCHFSFKLKQIKRSSRSLFAAGCLIFCILAIPIKLGVTQQENQRLLAQGQEKRQLVNLLRSHQKGTHWMFTDCPIYAFYAGLSVPPEIAVLSFIRIESKMITREQLLAVLATYQPEQALLCKSPTLRNELTPYLDQHYLKIYENEGRTGYLRRPPSDLGRKVP